MIKISFLTKYAYQIARMHLNPHYRVPLNIEITLTNRCNNRCVYCRSCELPQEDVLTTKILKRVLDEMKFCGTQRVHFTGGEIMLREDLGEVISYAKKLGLFVGIVTNGHRVADRINELKELDIVFVSYEGPPHIHSRLRGQLSVKDIESAFEALWSTGLCVWTTTVLTKRNVDFIDEIVTFVKQHSMKATFKIMEYYLEPPAYLHPLKKDVEKLILSREERKRVFRKLIDLKRLGAPIASSTAYLNNTIDWPHDDKMTDPRPSPRFKCFAGRAYGVLESDGMLYGCCWDKGRVEGRSVLERGFRDAWEKLQRVEECRSCVHPSGVESNLLFSLDASTVLNWFGQLNE